MTSWRQEQAKAEEAAEMERARREHLEYAAKTVGATINDVIRRVDASLLPVLAEIIVKIGKEQRELIESAVTIATKAGSQSE